MARIVSIGDNVRGQGPSRALRESSRAYAGDVSTPKSRKASRARANSSAAKWGRVSFEDNRSTRGVFLGGQNCWCGEPSGHPWAGKTEGAPHPKA